jgi:hypothetical protein
MASLVMKKDVLLIILKNNRVGVGFELMACSWLAERLRMTTLDNGHDVA